MNIRQQLVDKFQNGKVIQLKDADFNENKFRVVRGINFWNPFLPEIFLSEINGKIEEGKIFCEIGISFRMKIIAYIDSIILLLIAFGLLLSSEFNGGLAVLIFLIIIDSYMYFRVKYEIGILTSYMDELFIK